jgi:hypothetical protein
MEVTSKHIHRSVQEYQEIQLKYGTYIFRKKEEQGGFRLVRFLVELIHSGSNLRFDMSVVFMASYFFSGRRRPHRQRDALGN